MFRLCDITETLEIQMFIAQESTKPLKHNIYIYIYIYDCMKIRKGTKPYTNQNNQQTKKTNLSKLRKARNLRQTKITQQKANLRKLRKDMSCLP